MHALSLYDEFARRKPYLLKGIETKLFLHQYTQDKIRLMLKRANSQ